MDAEEPVVPFSVLAEQDYADTPSTPTTTNRALVRNITLQRDDNIASGTRFIEDSFQFTPETIAMAQVARLAYWHTGALDVQDVRRVIHPFPDMIKIGDGDTGIFSDPHNTWVDTGTVPYKNVLEGVPDGLMVYRPMSRVHGGDPLMPILFSLRGSDNFWDAAIDWQLNQSTDTVVPLYETQLAAFVTYIEDYLLNVNDAANWRLCGHSLGGKYATDILYKLLTNNKGSITLRCDGVYAFNPFLPADTHFRTIYGAASSKRGLNEDLTTGAVRTGLRTHLHYYIIKGDFASQQLLRTPIDNVNIFGSDGTEDIITDDS